MPLLPGSMGEELRAQTDDRGRVELADAVGEALAALHEAEAEFFGPYDAQLDAFIEMDDFADWTLHRLEHWRKACRSVNALSTEAELYIEDLVDETTDALREPFTPVLVHHDFKHGNLNFDASTFDATGVFDLFEAYLGAAGALGEPDLESPVIRGGEPASGDPAGGDPAGGGDLVGCRSPGLRGRRCRGDRHARRQRRGAGVVPGRVRRRAV